MTQQPNTRRRRNCRGLTLTEVAFSTLLVGIVIVASMRGVSGVLKTWRTSERRQERAALAEHLMSEVLQQYYIEPVDTPAFGMETGESTADRSAWDDVDDYYNWSKSPPQDRTGANLVEYNGWTRSCTVAHVTIADPTTTSGTDTGLKRITVTVTDPLGGSTTLEALRSKMGALEIPLAEDQTIQTYIETDIAVGAGKTVFSGANLPNHSLDE